MTLTLHHSLLRLSLFVLFLPVGARADQWTPPTPEELSMTSQPQVPGAPAVYLLREETTEDDLHMFSIYVRLKVLTEGGKRFGDIELKYAAGSVGFNISDIAGRTIHSDGTVVPFTGKPYEKLIEKGRGYKYMAKVFSMPDVQVGSIIEYRYKLRFDDHFFVPPQWYVQSDLYTRRAHYSWKPTSSNVVITNERGQVSAGISWTPVLPAGTKVTESSLPDSGLRARQMTLELAMRDVAPAPDEEYMPPISSFTYRVLFYYSPYRSADEFWKNEAKYWSKERDKFIGPGRGVTAAIKDLVLPGDTQEQKLRKIYAAVQQLDNTHYTRSHSGSEDKSLGFGEIKTTDDIWQRKRGNDDQLAELFVAMARAAGMKAYLMALTSRDTAVFYTSYLSLSQLDDDIAIVNVDGKDLYFDPGSHFCPYGHLEWKHSMAGGIRQVDGGGVVAATPEEPYTSSRTLRVANLTLDEQGIASGTLKMTYIGAPALHWRQASLGGDQESLKRDLKNDLEEHLPRGLDISVSSIEKLVDYEQPLVVLFDIKGNLGSATGKRLLLPGDLFEANTKTAFPHEKRDIGIYFHYGQVVQDAIRITFPKSFAVESLPVSSKLNFSTFAAYTLTSEASSNNFTIRRNYVMGEVIYKAQEYPELRTFYSGMEAKDQQSVVLKAQPLAESKTPSGAD